MLEMSFAGKDHRNAVFVGGGDNFIILLRTTRLGNCDDSRLCSVIDIVREREESIGGHNRAL